MIIAAVLDPLEQPLTWLLEHLHSDLALPWAWAVVALTLIVRFVLVPVTVKQIRSMQRMQQFLPEMKAIQQRHKGNRQKANEELMKFYREHSINPAASCLPMLLQIPVFFALYFVLKDFEKEVYRDYPGSDLHWLGFVPNITENITEHWSGYLLLIVYAGSQLASTYFMSTTMDKTQRYIFMVLPLGFVFFILSGSGPEFPVGLLLYWVTTNLWTVGQGLVTRRLVPRSSASPSPAKRSSRTPPRGESSGGGGESEPDGRPPPTASAPPRRVKRKKKGVRR
ncbi:MAG: YidC/Oxa1 family membrane protein insertase [Gaiellaceae bacterium]